MFRYSDGQQPPKGDSTMSLTLMELHTLLRTLKRAPLMIQQPAPARSLTPFRTGVTTDSAFKRLHYSV